MPLKKKYDINQLRDYASLFLRSEVNRILKEDFSSIDVKVKRYDNRFCGKSSYSQYIRHAYKVIRKFYPNEYVLKNEFINKWLINEIGNCRSVIFNEFRIGSAIADLAMFNGTSKVFEIKTKLDKEHRLSSQISGYEKIFNEIYLIVPYDEVDKYLKLKFETGLITYCERDGQFSYIKPPVINLEIDSSALMRVLHTHEYKSIVTEYFGVLPVTTSFNQFDIYAGIIGEIPRNQLNSLFIKTMKRRRINNKFNEKQNTELNQACLALNLTDKQIGLLTSNLNNSISK